MKFYNDIGKRLLDPYRRILIKKYLRRLVKDLPKTNKGYHFGYDLGNGAFLSYDPQIDPNSVKVRTLKLSSIREYIKHCIVPIPLGSRGVANFRQCECYEIF